MNQKQEQTDQKATPKPKKVPIIQHKVQKQTVSAMANTTNSQSEEMIALKKAVSTQKERQIESDFAFQDMKETLKRTREGLAAAREDNTRLKARQVRPFLNISAIFCSKFYPRNLPAQFKIRLTFSYS